MRFVYLCKRCLRVVGMGKWPHGEEPETGFIDTSMKECTCPPFPHPVTGRLVGEGIESTMVRAPAPPFVR